MRIRDSVALVTGASSGIGWATAVRLSGAGARLVVHGRDQARLAELADLVNGVPLTGELAAPGQVDRLAEAALDVAGRVDIVVHNAGSGWAGSFDRMPQPDIGRLIAVNLAAPIGLTRAVLPQMRARGDGHLMFVTSIAGRVGVAGEAVYAATKAGLDAFAESLRLELRGSGVGVGALAPGVVQTRFFERRGQPYARSRPRPIPAERVADVLVRAIKSGRDDRYVPGWLRLPVAVRAVAPGLYRRLAGRYGGS
ncbi:SDR family oxidoreductase [Phytohabitans flavus]